MRIRNSGILLLLAFGLIISACTDSMGPIDKDGPEIISNPSGSIQMVANGSQHRRIVVFKKGEALEKHEQKLKDFGIQTIKKLKRINAVAAMIPDHAKAQLLNNPNIIRIDEDIVITMNKRKKPPPPPPDSDPEPTEEIPWSVLMVNADDTWSTNTGAGVKVAIFDTGIDLDHPDLAGNIKGGYNAVGKPAKRYNDDNGHGTHVAGTVAAIDNEIGVVGVAPQAWLYSVKVLDRNGSGYLSDIIEGFDWAIDNSMQVINMSLSTDADVQSFHDAVTDAFDAGIVLVCAAGNDGTVVDYPAAYSETIAVSAISSQYAIASWSNTGEEIDFAAPGVDIYSTTIGGGYGLGSGTSMASPCVAGVAALAVKKYPGYSPDQILGVMESTADYRTNLTDDQQGAGVVDASAGQ